MHIVRKAGVFQRPIHQLHPAVARGLSDRKRRMAHPQPGVTALFNIGGRSAEPINQEVRETLFGSLQILFRIHGTQDVVSGHLAIECGYQPAQPIFAHDGIDFVLFHSYARASKRP